MASDEHVKNLEGDLRRERLARRIVDQTLRELIEERDKLKAALDDLKKKK